MPPTPLERAYWTAVWKRRLALAMAGLCLILALVKFHALWPYQLSRWGICAGSVWLSIQSAGWRRVLCGALAVIYNPIQPIAFGELWPWVNGFSAGCFIAAGWHPGKLSKAALTNAGRGLRWWFTSDSAGLEWIAWRWGIAALLLLALGLTVRVAIWGKFGSASNRQSARPQETITDSITREMREKWQRETIERDREKFRGLLEGVPPEEEQDGRVKVP